MDTFPPAETEMFVGTFASKDNVERKRWLWKGYPGHRSGSFHLHTHVGRWCMSTVGGCTEGLEGGWLFETRVFALCDRAQRHLESVEVVGSTTADEAQAVHETLCKKYQVQPDPPKSEPAIFSPSHF